MSNEESKTAVTSPPAGTGNVPGLGEAFNINLSTGQGMYSYKILLPDGIAGHTPVITLEYSHGVGHGAFGLGWRIPLRSISRRLDFGVPDTDTAERYMDSGQDILPMADGSYAARMETIFSRYSRVGNGWRLEERNGKVHELGFNASARLSDPEHSDRINEWLLERSSDISGNAIEYNYLIDEGTAYIAEIRYAVYALRFIYENRSDPRFNGRTGYLRCCKKHCSRIELFIDPGTSEQRIRSWIITYTMSPGSNISLLDSIQMISHGVSPDGSTDIVRAPAKFQYTPFNLKHSVAHWMSPTGGSSPPPLTDPDVAMVTMDNAPLPGVLSITNGKQYYWRNLGNQTWATARPISRVPAVTSFARSGLAFIDMDASGTADLLVAAGNTLPGYYENGGSEGWRRFVAYPKGRRSTPFWTSGQVRLSDINGDGRIDAIMSTQHSFAIWLNEGKNGWSDPLLMKKGKDNSLPDFSEPLVFLADMNGDGLDDLVRVRSGLVEYWPGLGYGRFGERQTMTNSPRLRNLTQISSHTGAQPLILVDVDGDGCADMVRVTADGLEVNLNRNGTCFSDQVTIPDVPTPIPGTIRAINMRGRSGTGLVWNTKQGKKTGYVSIELGDEKPAYLLNHVENGMGLVSEIFYRSAVEDFCRDQQKGIHWDTNFPFPYLVVAGTKETDTVSGRICEVDFRYHEAHFEQGLRQFQGFRRAERQEKGDESRNDTLTIFHFLMGQERIPGNGPEYASLNGMLSRTEIYSLDGSAQQNRLYRQEESDYAISVLQSLPDDRKRIFISVINHRIEDIERTDDLRGEEKSYIYDVAGNVIKETLRGYGKRNNVVQTEKTKTTEIIYAQSSTRYLADKPACMIVRDSEGSILSEEHYYYDGQDFQGLPMGQATHGLLTRKSQLVMNKTEFEQHYTDMNSANMGYFPDTNADVANCFFINAERHAYNEHGVKKSYKDPLGNQTSYTFDTNSLFRIELITSLGTTRFEYNRHLGQPTHIIYPDSTETFIQYDAQGRVLATALPGESLGDPPTVYSYNDLSIPASRTGRFRSTNNAVDEAIAVTYFDGHGKEFQQRTQKSSDEFVVSGLRMLNPWGDLKKEYEPSFSNNATFGIPPTTNLPCRRIFYDGLGRVIKTINFNDGISSAEYYPFEIITKDANDNDNSAENIARGQYNTPHIEEFDVFRNRTRIVEDLGNSQKMVFSYLVGPQGELLQVNDDRGIMATYKYDRLGQRLQINQRETGERRIWYDGRGVAIRTVDGNGNDLQAETDSRRRLTRLKHNNVILEEYTYDDNNQHALGRLAKVAYLGGYQKFDYDVKGRLTAREYHFDSYASNQRLAYSYDRLGRQIKVNYFDGQNDRFNLQYELTSNGWIKAIPGFINHVEHNSRGLPKQIEFNNGVITQTSYTSGPGRIATQTSIAPSGLELEKVTFGYDRMEMLLSSNDTAPGGRGLNNFSYDPLYQLTGAIMPGADAPQTNQYTYCNGMNLTRFDETSSNLHYDDSLHPNRLAGLTRQNNPRFNVTYDGNGNLLTLPGKTFSYNTKNELVRFQAADGLVADYCYDHKGIRISKKITDSHGITTNTYFLDNLMEIRNGQPAYFIYLGSLRVAIVANSKTSFVHGDYLGSTAFFTDDTATKITAIAYRPFGNIASISGIIDYRTFGIHPYDTESGMFYMRRRYYAPEIGRFLTPDPLALYQPTLNLHNPKALHPYAFVVNDPLNKTDLTGLSFWSVIGAIVGVIAAIAVAALVIMTGGLLGLVIGAVLVIGLVAVSYIVASATAGTDFGEFMRGFLIGFNAGLNAILATAIFGPVVGVALGVINFLAAFDTIANSSVYQGILGWSSWLMPMSWLATGVGLIFFVLNVIPVIFTGNQVESVKIHSLSIDWGTGTIVMEGGWTYLSGFNGGFNLGNFAYVTPGSNVTDHETGHTLSVAAFGSIFHFIGAIDENGVQSNPADAYAERLADSHDPNGPTDRGLAGMDPVIPMWV